MNGVFIVPTGVGCAIGGHAGDAVCAVNLIASLCDDLIVNPNAVNGSDINEMAGNCLYVEGSILDRFLEGKVGLAKHRRNRILLVANSPVSHHTRNSANAARVHLGVDVEVLGLVTPLVMTAAFNEDGTAGGEVEGWQELLDQIWGRKFDALAIHTPIDVPDEVVERYLERGGVNPWGGVEAKASKLIANGVGRAVAHAPEQSEQDAYFKNYRGVPNPRMAAEVVSVSYLHCVLKGLARAPRPVALSRGNLEYSDFEFLVTPDGCYGVPHAACYNAGIEVIVVRENRTVLGNEFPDGCTFVENYLEAAGVIACRRAGIGERWVRPDARNY
jgi:hypothetical protein